LTRAFYSRAFGWDFTDYGPTYSATCNGVTDLGLQGDPSEALSAPLPVIRVDDLEAAFDAVGKAGGVIARAIFSFPGGRRFHFIDPSGSELAVWSEA
jgi:predicted enzyme related to lactoylglutathione lyase